MSDETETETETEPTETESPESPAEPCETPECPPEIVGPPPAQRPPADGRVDPLARLRELGDTLAHAGPDRRLTTDYLRLRRSLR